MTHIPSCVLTDQIPGLTLLRQGKVRDTYKLPGHPDKLLVVASDRLSIFEFVMPALVRKKGEVLTAMNIFWREKILRNIVPGDILSHGRPMNDVLPEAARFNPELQRRATVVNVLDMIRCEAVVRGALAGTGLSSYHSDNGKVCGHVLPKGLQDGDRLPYPIFTPTTKAEVGHDEHVDADWAAKKFGHRLERRSLQIFSAAQAYAATRGILIADTKCEFGYDFNVHTLTLGDEVLTPDSSRFWDLKEWEASRHADPRRSPNAYDKQFVREWGKKLDINNRNPELEEDLRWIETLEVPADVVTRTTQLYLYIFWRLTGKKLEDFQQDDMRIQPDRRKLRIEVVTGSESDVAQMKDGLDFLDKAQHDGRIEARRHIISCHRNPLVLAAFAKRIPSDAIVIAGAGMAAALPGVLKALLVYEGKPDIPVIGVAFEGKNEIADIAARLSIEQLPGQPVQLRPDGTAHFGPDGFNDACHSAIYDEFLPTQPGIPKPAQLDLPLIDKIPVPVS